jgi:hypothetical protein
MTLGPDDVMAPKHEDIGANAVPRHNIAVREGTIAWECPPPTRTTAGGASAASRSLRTERRLSSEQR